MNDANENFDHVFAWLVNLQRDPNALEKINTRENIIREVAASLGLSGIDVKQEWIGAMRQSTEAAA